MATRQDFQLGDIVQTTFGTVKIGSVEGINYTDSTFVVCFDNDVDDSMTIHSGGLTGTLDPQLFADWSN